MPSDVTGAIPGDDANRVILALGGEIPAALGDSWQSATAIEMLPAVQLELLLPRTTFLAGEAVSPRTRVTNQSEDPVMLLSPRVMWIRMQTDASRALDYSRGLEFVPGAWPVSHPGPHAYTLAPGETSTWSNALQLPFEDEAADPRSVQLQAKVQSPSPGPHTGTNMATWPSYRTPPVELTLGRPQAAQQLRVHLEADRQQFSVRVTDANGAPVEGELLVAWMLTSGWGKMLGQLREKSGSAWSGTWKPHLLTNNAPLRVQLWVAGPGYVTGLAEAQVPSGPDQHTLSGPLL